MAGGCRGTFLLPTQRGQRKAGSCGITALSLPPLLSARLAPDGAEGQAVALPNHQQKSDQPPGRMAAEGILGHFWSRQEGVRSTATAAPLNFSTLTLFCNPH